MRDKPCPVYLFRCEGFAPSGNAVVSIALIDEVVAVYGGGGVFGEGGLSEAFGGAAVFRNDATDECFAGVWGARNASRFRREIRERMPVVLLREVPQARLVVWNTQGKRPARQQTGGG